MSLRDQPYLPLYVQDFLTDEKLIECSAAATGVYIRIMCIMHKSEQYGKILLRQKPWQIKNFAIKLAKHLPFEIFEIEECLTELIESGVLSIQENALIQKRMVIDNELSIKRSISGSKGANAKWGKNNFAKANLMANSMANGMANDMANTEIENENENKHITNLMYWENSKNSFLQSDAWKYQFVQTKNITKDELEKEMHNFINDLELKQDYKPLKELMNHFTNYYNKMKKDGKQNSNGVKKPGFRNTIENAGTRFGEIGNTSGADIAQIGRDRKTFE